MSDDAVSPVTHGETPLDVGLSPNRIAEVVANRGNISEDAAQRLALFFGNNAEVWTNLQARYEQKLEQQGKPADDVGRVKADRAA
jgi:addiction module HigA family antidote